MASSVLAAGLVVSCVGDSSLPPGGLGEDAGALDATTAPDGNVTTTDSGAQADAADGSVVGPWTKAFTSNTALGSVVTDSVTGDVYVGGSVRGNAPELGIVAANGDNNDALLVKLSGATGAVLWAKAWGGGGDDAIASMQLAGGQLTIVGVTTGTQMSFPSATKGATLSFPASTSPLGVQSFIARIDANSGTPSWAFTPDANETVGTAHASRCQASATASDGLTFVACFYSGKMFGGPSAYAPDDGSGFQSVVLKVTSAGSVLGWVKSLSSTNGAALISSLLTHGGYLYASGFVKNNLQDRGDAGATNVANGSAGNNAFVVRFPETGGSNDVVLWNSDGTNAVSADGLAVSGADLVVVGRYGGTPVFGVDAGTAAGSSDAFAARIALGLGGGISSFARFSGSSQDGANAVVVDGTATPSIWVGGSYVSPDLKIGSSTLPAAAGAQFGGYVAKLGVNGVATSATGYFAPNGSTQVGGLAVDNAHGYLLTVGTYGGTITFDDKTASQSAAATAGFVLRRKL